MVTLTKTAVTLYDIQSNEIWDQMSHAQAESDLHCARKDGDHLQEYDTTDRDGNPLRIALVIENRKYGEPDMGGVYEFTLLAPALPSTERRPVPDSSSRDYGTHHDAVYADPRVTDLDTAARYISETSTDEGATWTADPMPAGWVSVCGGHVQVEAASALLSGWDVVADGTTRIIREWDGSLIRWTLTVLTPEETAAMEEMIHQSRARAR